MFKPFFVHFNNHEDFYRGDKYRAFTAKISPDPTNNRNALLQVAMCSGMDQFCRKTGRELAANKTAQSVPTRDISKELTFLSNKVYDPTGRGSRRGYARYDYVFRYMLP